MASSEIYVALIRSSTSTSGTTFRTHQGIRHDASSNVRQVNQLHLFSTSPRPEQLFDHPYSQTWSLLDGRNETEFAVDTTDSMGLSGRSGTGGVETGNNEAAEKLAMGNNAVRRPCGIWLATFTEVEPFIVASLRRKSSKGAPILLDPPIGTLWRWEKLRMGALKEGEVKAKSCSRWSEFRTWPKLDVQLAHNPRIM